MKLFLDTANRDEIKGWARTGVIDGVTTNPSHLSKENPDTKKVKKDTFLIKQLMTDADTYS